MEVRENEIVKALEYCLAQGITSECERCRDKIGCRDTLLRDALDLINSQKAEIEDLGKYKHDYYVLKSEARKEFWEQIKAMYGLDENDIIVAVNIKDIDDLLTGMEERE